MIASKLLVLATLGLVAAIPQSTTSSCDSDCAGSIAAADTDPENCYGTMGILHRKCYICVKRSPAIDSIKGQANIGDSQKWAAICGQEKGDDWTNVLRYNEEATTKNSTSSSSSSSDSSDDKDSDEDADADEDDTTTTKADSKSETASGTASASASASTTPVSSSGAFKAFNVGQLTVAGAAVLGAVAFVL